MRHLTRIVLVVIAAAVWALLAGTAEAGSMCSRPSAAGAEVAGFYIGATWTPRVTIARSALAELRARIAE